MKLYIVAGARPNFMKVAPIIKVLDGGNYPDVEYKLIHTGQHYDFEMSESFFKDLKLPDPDAHLNVGSGTHAYQTALIMQKFEQVCLDDMPDIVMVVGDVNSTLACALVAAKLPVVKLAHIEAGCRCDDRSMPEEINRIVTDSLSDYCFAMTHHDVENLEADGIGSKRIYLVGNVMIDNLMYYLPLIDNNKAPKNSYILLTLHRAATVDNQESLSNILRAMDALSKDIGIEFLIHPRTENRISEFGLEELTRHLHVRKPVGYLENVMLMNNADLVITDSGGMQVETSVLGVPCLTLRESTEHASTLLEGTNLLVGSDIDIILTFANWVLSGKWKPPEESYKFERNASKRIVEILYGYD